MLTPPNQLPEERRGVGLPIRRTPAAGVLAAVITSPDMLGAYTHYYGGRTVPCARPDCKACADGLPYRWHGYVSAWDLRTAEHVLLEVTAAGAEPLVEYHRSHGTLRGCEIRASRPTKRHNGRVAIHTRPYDLKTARLPREPNLLAVLAHLWSLPLEALQDAHPRVHQSRAVIQDSDARADEWRDELRYAPRPPIPDTPPADGNGHQTDPTAAHQQ